MSFFNKENNEEKSGRLQERYIYVGAGVVMLALIALAIFAYTHRNPEVAENTVQPTNQNNANNVVLPVATSTEPTTPVGTKKLSYGDAIKKYPYRFQFVNCSGNPGTIAVKQGSIVMLDNRDKVAHTIKADSQTFRIAGYDYALLHTSVISNVNILFDGGGAAKLYGFI